MSRIIRITTTQLIKKLADERLINAFVKASEGLSELEIEIDNPDCLVDLGLMSYAGWLYRNQIIPTNDYSNIICKDGKFLNANLGRLKLCNANFENADLSQCYIGDSDAKNANFNDAICEYTEFENTDLSNTTFLNAYLHATDFTNANLENAVFSGSIIDDATFFCANLENAVFMDCKIHSIRLLKANLTGVKFG